MDERLDDDIARQHQRELTDVERAIMRLIESAYQLRDFNQGDPPAFQFWAGQAVGLSTALEIVRVSSLKGR